MKNILKIGILIVGQLLSIFSKPKPKFVPSHLRPGYESPFAKPMTKEQKDRLQRDVILYLGTHRKTMKYEKQARKLKDSGDKRPFKSIVADLSLEDMRSKK